MDLNGRINEFISSKGLSVAEFERICGLSNGYVRKVKDSLGKRGLFDILRNFPELNKDWLLTGEGKMLNPSVVQKNQNGDNIHGQSVTVNKSESEKLLDIIRMQAEQLSKSQEQISKGQEQIDRLLTLLENK